MGHTTTVRLNSNTQSHEQSAGWLCRAIDVCHLLIGLVWISSGVAKITEPSQFSAIVQAHGLLPTSALWLIWALPLFEVVIGFGLLAFGTRKRLSGLFTGLSLGLILLLTGYLWAVPREELSRVGCGCGGMASRVIRPDPTVDILLNLAFAVMICAAFGLRFVIRRQSSKRSAGRQPHSAQSAPTIPA